MATVIHATHEALFKIGGIGAVLEGLLTSQSYKNAIDRTFLVGPIFVWNPEGRLEENGEVLYSRVTGVDQNNYGKILGPIEERYGTKIIYGRRRLKKTLHGASTPVEVVLVDQHTFDLKRLEDFKYFLAEWFGLNCAAFEHIQDFEQYIKIAAPGFEACKLLLGQDPGPHHVIAHEFMGVPLALRALLEKDPRFRTIFHAHETATIRPIVEEDLGHDTRFYNVLQHAFDHGLFLEDCFGPQDGFYKHVLLSLSHHFDRIFAVGDYVIQELQFLSPSFRSRPIHLVYNGIPAAELSLGERRSSKRMLTRYAGRLLGFEPDYVFAHVSRLVKSKGVWRDLRVLEHLADLLRYENKTAVLFLLSSSVAEGRSIEDIEKMEKEYGWPVEHKEGWPDLVGYEAEFYKAVRHFNATTSHVRVVFLNQFGWSQDRCGKRMPREMRFEDLRKGQDVEFGQSIYEPFGIAQLEALSFGGICVPSNVCGCAGFVDKIRGEQKTKNVIVADYITLPRKVPYLHDLLSIGLKERNEVETLNSMKVASMIFAFLPRTQREERILLEKGQALAGQMSWDAVARDYFLPGLPS